MDYFSKSYLFLYSCIAFILGIGLASFFSDKILERDLFWFGLSGVFLISAIAFNNLKIVWIPALIGFFLFFGIWRYSLSLPEDSLGNIWHYNGKEILIRGTISKEPDVRTTNQKLEIETIEMREYESMKTKNVGGKILVTTDLYPAYQYGDELELKCELKTPEPITDFFYDRYLARYDIYSVCYYPEIKVLGNGGNTVYKLILNFKSKLNDLIKYGLPEPESGLAGPIILGYKNGLSDFWQNKFSQAGLTHIMAVSGLNISILAAIAMSISINLGFSRRWAFRLSVLFLVSYIILVGLQASALRAGVMGFLVLWAIQLGRLSNLYNSLAFAAALLLLFNPKMLRDDVGFQLSFFAVLGLAFAMPIVIEKLEKFSMWKKNILEALAITLAAQIFTLPIIAFNFDQISLIAPVSNLIVLWTVYPMMVAILAALLFSFFVPFLAPVFFLPAYLLLKYMTLSADWLTRIPFAYIQIDYLWPGWVIIYYGAVVGIIIYFKKTITHHKLRIH